MQIRLKKKKKACEKEIQSLSKICTVLGIEGQNGVGVGRELLSTARKIKTKSKQTKSAVY